MKIGDRVVTRHGIGEITGKDLPNSEVWRWTVKLECNPFTFPVACYFSNEIKLLKQETKQK